jgi:hypothetical protein
MMLGSVPRPLFWDSKMKEISINSCGPAQWLRYFIQRGDQYWTGAGWTSNFREARLYAQLPVVMEQWVALTSGREKEA